MSARENIRVIPDTLNNVVVAVNQGQYRIPQFQREYVWERSKVIELFDSIYKEYPIGSFFLWKAGREFNHLFRHSIDLNIRPIRHDDDVCFILDGQQRITSIYVTLLGLTARGTNYGRICFDVKEEKFVYRDPDPTRYIALHDIWQSNLLKIARQVPEAYQDALGQCYEILRTYPVSIVQVSDKDLPAVCKIFQRINQGGKRLDRFDLISAMTFSPDFDLREKFKEDVLEKLVRKSFGEIAPSIVTQLMALIKKGACTEKAEFSLSATDIQSTWKTAVESILLAADTLRKCAGVQNAAYLPYDALLTLLTYFYAKSGQRALNEDQLKWVQQWFWRASFSQHYGSGGPTKMGRDKDMFDKLLKGEFSAFEPATNLTADTLVGTKMTWSRSAVRNAFLCLLAMRKPLHLINNTPLDLITGGVSDFTNPEKHHIFPQAFLAGTSDVEVHALPNFCFLPAELNKRILDSRPSIYFSELRSENTKFEEAAKTHLIPTGRGSGVNGDDYLEFLKARSHMPRRSGTCRRTPVRAIATCSSCCCPLQHDAAGVALADLDIQVITVPVLRLDLAADRRNLAETVDRLRPRLLILDPFVRLHRIDENASGEVAPLLAYLRELQRRYGVAVLVVHHAKKGGAGVRAGQALRGSSEFHAWGDSNLYLRRDCDELSLTVEHRAAPSPRPLIVELIQ